MINIRKATEQDSEKIYNFIYELAEYEGLTSIVTATPNSIKKELFKNKSAEVIILELNKTAIGFALYFYNFSTFLAKKGLYIEDLYIQPKYRGNGYGKLIFKELAKIAKKNDCCRMEWCCLDWNESSLKFYQKIEAKVMKDWLLHRLTIDGINKISEKI